MVVNRALETLLRSLDTHTDLQDTPGLLGTASSILAALGNPLNVTLLTANILSAPALWERHDGLHTCLKVMGVFHSAFLEKTRDERGSNRSKRLQSSVALSHDEWIRAVVKGADDRSATWKHLLVLGGLVVASESQDSSIISLSLRRTMRNGLVRAANLALDSSRNNDGLGELCIALVLNYTFAYLTDFERSQLNFDRLLPILVHGAFFSREGYHSAYILGIVDLDIGQAKGEKFTWSSKSASFYQVNKLLSLPLISSMGPLSRLIAHTVENVRDARLVHALVDGLVDFSRSAVTGWRQNKLSDIDASEEMQFLDDEALNSTVPSLWKVLKGALFATVIVLGSVMSRVLSDRALASDIAATTIALQTLNILRNLSFVSSKLGSTNFSQYNFVYLTAIDILTNYPQEADVFVKHIRPTDLGQIPKHPLDRTLVLFFLNTAEHLAYVLSPITNEELLIGAAGPYLVPFDKNNLLETFEAAHCVVLSVLSAPQNAPLATKHLPFYVDALFKVFPKNLSSRQFRFAYKTLLRITAPPSPLSVAQPEFQAVLLEVLHERALSASTSPIPPSGQTPSEIHDASASSEQAVLIITLLDVLPYLTLGLLDEWLPRAARLANLPADEQTKSACKNHFWEILVNGEMDAQRSELCVVWWTSRGGHDMVMVGDGATENDHLMSGALNPEPEDSKL